MDAVILATGMSKRMGAPKSSLPLKGKSFFLFAVDAALSAGVSPIILVVGQHEDRFREFLADRQRSERVEK